MTLSIEPTFNVRQDIYQRLPWRGATGSFEEVMGSGSSVSAVTSFARDTRRTALGEDEADQRRARGGCRSPL